MGVLVISSFSPASSRRISYEPNESREPGPSVSKLVPKVQSTAKYLYTIYLGMTVLQIILLLLGGIPVFDSLMYCFRFCRNRRLRNQK
ncbi:MAG: hypothetical protein ACLTX6_01060 [Lachnospiraceae bacterium]